MQATDPGPLAVAEVSASSRSLSSRCAKSPAIKKGEFGNLLHLGVPADSQQVAANIVW